MIDLDVRTVLCASTLCLAGPAMASPSASDLNHDGTTDGRDLAMVLAAWNTADHFSDVNGDGLSNGIDLALVLGYWGTDGVGDVNQDGVTNGADLAVLLGSWGDCGGAG